MLMLTRKTEYSLVAMTHLAQYPDECNSAREIANIYNMRLPLLMNILKLLNQKKLTVSSRGPRGGYRLARPASEISLADIIIATEGPIHLVKCADQPDKEVLREIKRKCDMSGNCPIRSPIHRVHDRLVDFLDKVTLAEITDDTACNNIHIPIHTET